MENIETLVLGAKAPITTSYSSYFEDNFNVDGSPSDVDLESIFNNPQDNIQKIVEYSKYCYRKYGLIMRTINLYRDFGSQGLKLVFPKKDEKVKSAINEYNEQVNIKQFLRDAMTEIVLTGNLACYDRQTRIEIYPIHRIDVVPILKDNVPLIAYKVEDLSVSLNDYGEEINKHIETAFPTEIVNAINQGKSIAVLNPDNAHFAKINASQYERYGVSVIMPAFEDLAHKNLLKQAERATANDFIEKIMMIKIGDKDNRPSNKLVQEYNDLFNGVKGSVRFTVPYYVSAEYIEPSSSIFGADKFVEIDVDILNTLGISLSLLRGSDGSNYADGILNFAGLSKTIENAREPIARILEDIYKQVLIRNHLDPKKAPKVTFEEVVIDKNAKFELMMELFTNAGLPYQILYEETGFDFDRIKLIREEENSENLDETFKVHSLPFSGNSESENSEDEDKDDKGNDKLDENGKPKDKGGAPKKSMSERKSNKEQSNKSPRTGINSQGLRGNIKKK